jgi:hypothetical protein
LKISSAVNSICKTDRGWNIRYHRHGRFGSGFNAENLLPPLAKLKTCSLTGIFVVINIFFLSVALLYIYAAKNGIEVPTDLVTESPEPICFP